MPKPRTAYDHTVTLNKRKRGIIRKAIELYDLCNQELYIAIFDKQKNHLVEYKSSDILNPQKLTKMGADNTLTHERYDCEDYDRLEVKFITQRNINFMQQRKLMTWAGANVAPVAIPSLKVLIPIPPLIIPKPSVSNIMKAQIDEQEYLSGCSSLSSISAKESFKHLQVHFD